jgi:hypothetical protein
MNWYSLRSINAIGKLENTNTMLQTILFPALLLKKTESKTEFSYVYEL